MGYLEDALGLLNGQAQGVGAPALSPVLPLVAATEDQTPLARYQAMMGQTGPALAPAPSVYGVGPGPSALERYRALTGRAAEPVLAPVAPGYPGAAAPMAPPSPVTALAPPPAVMAPPALSPAPADPLDPRPGEADEAYVQRLRDYGSNAGVWGGIKELGRGLARGVYTAPELVADAGAAVGRGLGLVAPSSAADLAQREQERQAAAEGQPPWLKESDYSRAQEHPYGSLAQAGESTVQSLGPMAAGAAIGAGVGAAGFGVGAVPGAAIGAAVGTLATVLGFGAQQTESSYEKIKAAQLQAGVPEPEAEKNAWHGGLLAGAIEAGGEAVGSYLFLRAGRLIPPAFKSEIATAIGRRLGMAPTDEGGTLIRSAASNKGALWGAAKDLALKIVPAEIGTEMLQAVGEIGVEHAYGAGPAPTVKDALQVVVPTLVMSGFGAVGAHGFGAVRRAQVNTLLSNPDDGTTEGMAARVKAAQAVENAVRAEDPALAAIWRRYAVAAIGDNRPMVIDEDRAYRASMRPQGIPGETADGPPPTIIPAEVPSEPENIDGIAPPAGTRAGAAAGGGDGLAVPPLGGTGRATGPLGAVADGAAAGELQGALDLEPGEPGGGVSGAAISGAGSGAAAAGAGRGTAGGAGGAGAGVSARAVPDAASIPWAETPVLDVLIEGKTGVGRRLVHRSADGSWARETLIDPDGTSVPGRERVVPWTELAGRQVQIAEGKLQNLEGAARRWTAQGTNLPLPAELQDALTAAGTERDRWRGLAAGPPAPGGAGQAEIETIKRSSAAAYLKALHGKTSPKLADDPVLAFLKANGGESLQTVDDVRRAMAAYRPGGGDADISVAGRAPGAQTLGLGAEAGSMEQPGAVVQPQAPTQGAAGEPGSAVDVPQPAGAAEAGLRQPPVGVADTAAAGGARQAQDKLIARGPRPMAVPSRRQEGEGQARSSQEAYREATVTDSRIPESDQGTIEANDKTRTAMSDAGGPAQTPETLGRNLPDGTPSLAPDSATDKPSVPMATTRNADTFDAARIAARAFQGKPLTNAATGMTATVSRNNLDKMLSAKAVGKSETPATHALAVANLDGLFERAILGWSKADRDNDPNITAVHRFFAAMQTDRGPRLVKLTVKEHARADQGTKIYSIEAIEINEKSPAAQWVDSTVRGDGLDPTSIRSVGDVLKIAQAVQDGNAEKAEKGPGPEPAPKPAISPRDAAAMDPAALSALLDQLEQEAAAAPAAEPAPASERVGGARRPRRGAKAEGEPPKPSVVRAGANLLEGTKDLADGILTLFVGNGTLRSGPAFDEESYAKARPMFAQAMQKYQEAGREFAEWVRYLVDQGGQSIMPYVRRFMADVQAGAVEVKGVNDEQYRKAQEEGTDKESLTVAAEPETETETETAAEPLPETVAPETLSPETTEGPGEGPKPEKVKKPRAEKGEPKTKKEKPDGEKIPRGEKDRGAGTVLVRPMDAIRRALAALRATDPKHYVLAVLKAATPGKVWELPTVREGATPGVLRAQEWLRGQLLSPLEYLGEKKGGSLRKEDEGFADAIVRWLNQQERRTDRETARAAFEGEVADYISTVEALGAKLSGAGNVAQLAAAMQEFLTPDPVQRTKFMDMDEDGKIEGRWHRVRLDQYWIVDQADAYGKRLIEMLRQPRDKAGRRFERLFTFFRAETAEDSPWYPFVKDEAAVLTQPMEPKRPVLKTIVREGFADVLQGRKPTSETVKAEFGFAGVPVGDYVNSQTGTLHLTGSLEGLHDLAALTGIDPKTAISFGGELHYSIGKLGRGGKASAFFAPAWPIYRVNEDGKEALDWQGMPIVESHVKAINITKSAGDGSVAHEWGHALDDALQSTREGRRMTELIKTALMYRLDPAKLEGVVDSILTGARQIGFGNDPKTKRGRLDSAIAFLENDEWEFPKYGIKRETDFYDQATQLGEYWKRPQELWARAWEASLYDWMGADRRSDYLVNDFVEEGKITKAIGYTGTPYPTGVERTAFSAMWREALKHIEWIDGKPHALGAFQDPLVAQRDALRERAKGLKEELNQRYAALNGLQSADKHYWYAYTEDRRGPGAQPRGFAAYDDAHRQGEAAEALGAVAYLEPLGPEEVSAFLLEPFQHDDVSSTIYLTEDERGRLQQIDRAGVPGVEGSEDQPPGGVSRPGAGGGAAGDVRGDTGGGEGGGRASDIRGGTPVQPGERDSVQRVPESADGAGGAGNPAAVPAAGNFSVTRPDELIAAGQADAFADNIRAIRLLKEIEAQGRLATPDEQAILIKFHGWGGLAKVFDYYQREPAWQRRAEALEQLLTPEELTAARASTVNANYTDPAVVRAMWSTLERMGFQGGRVLDPSCGVGYFYALMPKALEEKSKLLAIDLDPISARLAAQVLQRTAVKQGGFEDISLPERYFDLVVSNVPFADFSPVDKKYNPGKRFLHDYFFAKSIELVRPGGIVAFITARGTMDKIAKGGPEVRGDLAAKADLIGAVRLPENAFREAGMTTVTTDIIFLRRKAGDRTDLAETWVESKPMELEGMEGVRGVSIDQEAGDDNGAWGQKTANVNEYFHRHPEQMATRMIWRAGRYGNHYEPAMAPSDRPIGEVVQPLLARLPGGVMVEEGQASFADEAMYAVAAEVGDVKDGGFAEHEGKLWHKREGMLYPLDPPLKAEDEARVRAYLKVMQARRAVLNAELRQADDKELKALRKALRTRYDAFVKAHGALNLKENVRVLYPDPDHPAVLALEHWDSEQKTVTRLADIFTQRVVAIRVAPTHADSPLDALAAALNYRGRVDWKYMQSLTGQPFEAVREGLRGMVYNDPLAGWVTADAYLSGNVREKLIAARTASEVDDAYRENVAALEAIQPADLTPQEIHANLGANWVPAETVRDFIAHLLDLDRKGRNVLLVSYAKPTGKWNVQIGGENGAEATRNRAAVLGSARATATWGTQRANLMDLLDLALNGGVPRVTDPVPYVDDSGTTRYRDVVNEEQTEAARAKLQEIRDEFQRWTWADTYRAQELGRIYNDLRNAEVLRRFQHPYYVAGKPADAFPGQSPHEQLRDYQAGAVWRIQQDLDAYLGHEVGTGKAQPLDAKVLTPTGWKLMGDVTVGDVVVAGDGTHATVTGVYPQGQKDIFRVQFSDGAVTECCNEHLWLTQTYQERNLGQRARALGKQWPSGEAKVRSLAEIRETLIAPHLGAKNHSIPVVGAVQFFAQPVQLNGYLMGVLLGDGGMSSDSISLASGDTELIEMCVPLLPENAEFHSINVGDKCPAWRIRRIKARGYGKDMEPNPVVDALRKYGLQGVKSANKFVPDAYKYNTEDVRVAVLQGLMDTDGYIDKRGYSVYFYSVSQRLADDVEFLVQSLGGTVKRSIKTPTFVHKGERRIGQECHVLCLCLPSEIVPFRLPRKASAHKPKSRYTPIRYIVSVEPVGRKEAQCIMVDHPDHLYVTDDFIVTHNTFEMIAAGMELKRTGVKKKPMYAVLNSTVGQFRAEFLRLYPNANILSVHIGENNRQRRLALGRIANNNWDAVIVTHESFDRIPVSPDTEMRRINQELEDLEEALRAAREMDTSGGGWSARGKKPKNQAVKALEKAKKRLEGKLKALGDIREKDQGVTFEDLGVDMLFVDESQNYKNLSFYTKLQGTVKGLGNPKGSGRAWGLFMKGRYLQDTFGGGLVLASGTPVSNSVAEVYTIQRYLDYPALRAAGLHHFDRWAAEYGDIGTRSEYAPEGGGFREVVTFRRFYNAPEMLRSVYRRLDVMTATEAGVPRPAMTGGAPEQIVVPQTKALAAFQQTLIERAKRVRKNPRQALPDNMLNIVTDGRKAAMDMRMIDPANPDEADSKTNKAVDVVFREYQRTTQIAVTDPDNPKKTIKVDGVALIFADLGVPNAEGRFSIYDEIKAKLIARGVPAEQIAFAQETSGSTDARRAARAAQHARVRAGKIRIYIGSTTSMGTGVNVQTRVSMLLHMDVWWNLSNWLQRNGRGIRYGNLFGEVRVLNIGAERTVDTFVWDKVQQKGIIVDKILSKNLIERTIEDVSQDTMSAGEAMAAFSGDPRIKRRADLQADVRRMGALERAYQDARRDVYGRLNRAKKWVATAMAETPTAGEYRDRLEALAQDGGLLIFEPKRATATAFSFQDDAQNKRAWDIAKALIGAYQAQAYKLRDQDEAAIKKAEDEWEANPKHKGSLPWDQYPKRRHLPPLTVGVFAGHQVSATWTVKDETHLDPSANDFTSMLATQHGSYEFGADTTPRTLVQGLLAHIEEKNRERIDKLKATRREIPRLEEEYAKPFPQAAELREKSEELDRLTADLLLSTEDTAVVVDAEAEERAEERAEAAEAQDVAEDEGGGDSGVRFHLAYHGSPHDFDAFSLGKIGTGEGAQAFGWGLYFADTRGVANHYKKMHQSPTGYHMLFGKKVGAGSRARDFSEHFGKDVLSARLLDRYIPALSRSTGISVIDLAIESEKRVSAAIGKPTKDLAVLEKIRSGLVFVKPGEGPGRMYQVELTPQQEDYLDWDKALSEQSAKVREALLALRTEDRPIDDMWHRPYPDNWSGETLYNDLAANLGPQGASEKLARFGIPGIRFLDFASRDRGEGSSNYVIFDDKLVSIQAKYALGRHTFARQRSPIGTGEVLSAAFMQARADATVKAWKGLAGIPVRVVQRERELPAPALAELKRVRQSNAAAFPKAVWIPDAGPAGRGEIVLVADNLRDVRDGLTRLVHEAVGHAGVRAVFGPRLESFLDKLIATRSADVALYARQYGLDMERLEDRRIAAEELLAHMAEVNAEADRPFLERVYQAIRAAIRALGVRLRLSDADLREILAAAGRYVREGDGRGALGARERFGGRAEGRGPGAEGQRFMFAGQGDSVETDIARRDALISMVPVILGETLPATLHGKALRDEASRLYNAFKSEPVTTMDGREVRFTGVGLREVKQHSADRRVLDLLVAAPEALRVAIPLFSLPHERSGPQDSVRGWHYYGAKTMLGGREMYARLVVRESVNGDIYYDNDLTSVEDVGGRVGDAVPSKTGAATVSADDHSLVAWFARVNQASAPPDIRFSLSSSRPDGGLPDGTRDLDAAADSAWTRLKESIGNQAARLLPASLQGLTLRQLAEVGGKILPGIERYDALRRQMESARNSMMEEAGEFAQEVFAPWIYGGKDRPWWQYLKPRVTAEAKALFATIHAATLANVDPSQAHKPLSFTMALGPGWPDQRIEVSEASLADLKERIARWSRSAEDRNRAPYALAAMKQVERLLPAEKKRQAARPELVKAWNALSQGWVHDADGAGWASKDEAVKAKAEIDKTERLPTLVKQREDKRWIVQAYGAQEIYTQARDLYKDRDRQRFEALLERIKESRVLEPGAKEQQIARMRADYESSVTRSGQIKVEPYFPLYRTGQYYVSGRLYADGAPGATEFYNDDVAKTPYASEDAAWKGAKRDGRDRYVLTAVKLDDDSGWILREVGEPFYGRYATPGEAKAARAELAKAGYARIRTGTIKKTEQEVEGVTEGFIATAVGKLTESGDQEAADLLHQMYLAQLNELSQRTHFIHRKGIAGYEDSALAAFGHTMFHLSHQIAKMQYGPRMAEQIQVIEENNRENPDAIRGDTFLRELKERHGWVMNPDNAPWTNVTSALGFFWFLGVSPAAALVNLTQTPIIAYPILAARFDDWGGAAKAMRGALDDVRRGMGKVQWQGYLKGQPHPALPGNLSEQEKAAFEAWTLSGGRDVTQAHNLAGIGDSDRWNNSPAATRAMGILSSGFHVAEVINRDVTLLAAYRLARAKGMRHKEAVELADKLTSDAHLDYSNANRARFMQSNAAKALLMFKSYSQGILYLLGRSVWQATQGESPDVKREARQRLTGILGMTFLFSGAAGLPLLGTGFAMLNLVAAAFGDDDEPWDAETEFRSFLARTLPGPLATAIDRGAVNALTGLDVSSRVGLSSLVFREPERDLDGAGMYQYLVEQLLGPLGGIASSPFTAYDQLREGHVHRALEAMSPKFARDGLKAMRYASEGALTRRGDPVLGADDALNPWNVVWQALGFAPDKLNAAWDTTNMLKLYEGRIVDRRTALQTALALATIDGDSAGQAAVLPKIRAWNLSHADEPKLLITPRTVRASVRGRERYSERAKSGVALLPGVEGLRERIGVP